MICFLTGSDFFDAMSVDGNACPRGLMFSAPCKGVLARISQIRMLG